MPEPATQKTLLLPQPLSPADDIDPLYGATLREAVRAGVEACAYKTEVDETGMTLAGLIPVEL